MQAVREEVWPAELIQKMSYRRRGVETERQTDKDTGNILSSFSVAGKRWSVSPLSGFFKSRQPKMQSCPMSHIAVLLPRQVLSVCFV